MFVGGIIPIQAEPVRSSPRSTPKIGKSGKKGRPKEGAETTSPVPSSPPLQTQTQSSLPHPNLGKYLEQLAAVVANADLADGEDRRQDRRLGLEDAVKIAVAWKAVGACGADEKGGDGGRLSPSPTIVDVSTVAVFRPRVHSRTAQSALDVTLWGL